MRKRCACTHTHKKWLRHAICDWRESNWWAISPWERWWSASLSTKRCAHRSRSNTAHPSPSMLILIALTAHEQRSTDRLYTWFWCNFANTFWCNFTRDPLCLFLYCEKRFRFCGRRKKAIKSDLPALLPFRWVRRLHVCVICICICTLNCMWATTVNGKRI